MTIAYSMMKQQADQHHLEHHFNVGDMVFLCLQPYKKTSLKLKGHKNLVPRFYEPYKILQKIGHVAYKFELP